MPLNLVIGFPDAKMTGESSKVLYIGADGDKAKEVLNEPNKKYPVRERYVRPGCNGGRRRDNRAANIEEATQAEKEASAPEPELLPADPEAPAEESPAAE
jgi:hypothetical protein